MNGNPMITNSTLQRIVAVDIGKSGIKAGVVTANDSARQRYAIDDEIYVPYKTALSQDPLTLTTVVGTICDIVNRCKVPYQSARIALTYPLPTDVNGRIQERVEFPFLAGQTPAEVGGLIQSCIGAESVTLFHDSHAQQRFVLEEHAPQGVFAVLACGTSFAFALACSRYPDAFDGQTSTFSHSLIGEGHDFCVTCRGRCLTAWYKQLFKETGDTSPAILCAVANLMRLPISELFVTGGALTDTRVKSALDCLEVPLATAKLRLICQPRFSGAIGAALSEAHTTDSL